MSCLQVDRLSRKTPFVDDKPMDDKPMDDEQPVKDQSARLRSDIAQIARESIHDNKKMHAQLLDLIKTNLGFLSGADSQSQDNQLIRYTQKLASDSESLADLGVQNLGVLDPHQNPITKTDPPFSAELECSKLSIFDTKSIEQDLSDLIPSNSIKYQTIEEIAIYIEHLKLIADQYTSLSRAIDNLEFDQQEKDQYSAKVLDLIKNHVKHLVSTLRPTEIEINQKDITSNIINLIRDIQEERPELSDFDKDLIQDGLIKKKYKNKEKEISIKHFKDVIKKFAIYEVYKAVNPKRIAGESKKDNYIHNLIMGGKKLASKYQGGRPEEVASYKQSLINHLNKPSRDKGRGFSR